MLLRLGDVQESFIQQEGTCPAFHSTIWNRAPQRKQTYSALYTNKEDLSVPVGHIYATNSDYNEYIC